jgi:hypothetical protein
MVHFKFGIISYHTMPYSSQLPLLTDCDLTLSVPLGSLACAHRSILLSLNSHSLLSNLGLRVCWVTPGVGSHHSSTDS